MVFSRARRTGFTTCASGSSGARSWVGRESRLNCSRKYLKKFSCDQRENLEPATCNPEGLRYQAPGEWGAILGLDRCPETKTSAASSGQHHAGDEQEDGGQAIESGG